MIKTGSRKHSNSRRIADECRAQVEVNEGGFADCAKHCAEMKLRAEDLEEWIANLALEIDDAIFASASAPTQMPSRDARRSML